jgi:4-amino-4-deoxy-L-arabinose transferase-like glycosyltransferase
MNSSRLRRFRPHALPLACLALSSLVVYALAAWPISQPGTMDSHYYYGGGRSLLQNRAFVEPYIWNYLDDPPGLPAPSHLYWMPLPSILVALAQALLGRTFAAAQIPFILLAAALPLVSYGTSWTLSHDRRHAISAGLLTVFSGFYVPYWTIPETFAPFAVAGALALYGLGRWMESHDDRWLLGAGLLAGLGHLCRADGVLLLGTGLLLVLLATRRRPAALPRSVAALLVGYLAVMAPWFARNWHVIGRPLSAAGARTIFLRNYDELFSYGTLPSLEHYLAWGWLNIARSKFEAGWTNLQTFIAVNNLVFLAPLSLIGFWTTRRRSFLWPAWVYGAALYGVMTLLFTFPGMRGGLFHSSAALLPALFAASMVGLDAGVGWVARRRRRWDRHQAQQFFSLGVIALAMSMSLLIYSRQVIGTGSWAAPSWNQADEAMIEVGRWIKAQTEAAPVVMVGNPPAFTYHTGLWSVVIPNEGVAETVRAACRYGAQYIVLDPNRPGPLASLYNGQETHPSLAVIWNEPLGAPAGIVILEVNESRICQSGPNNVN